MRSASIVLLSLVGCTGGREASPDAIDSASGDQDATLAIGESRQLPGGLTLTLKAVSDDSRCPQDVTCVWAGSVAAGLQLGTSGGDTAVTLNSGLAPQAATFGGWRVTLGPVNPAPTSGQPIPPDAYRVTLQLHRD
jgi:hypothetical protein